MHNETKLTHNINTSIHLATRCVEFVLLNEHRRRSRKQWQNKKKRKYLMHTYIQHGNVRFYKRGKTAKQHEHFRNVFCCFAKRIRRRRRNNRRRKKKLYNNTEMVVFTLCSYLAASKLKPLNVHALSMLSAFLFACLSLLVEYANQVNGIYQFLFRIEMNGPTTGCRIRVCVCVRVSVNMFTFFSALILHSCR